MPKTFSQLVDENFSWLQRNRETKNDGVVINMARARIMAVKQMARGN